MNVKQTASKKKNALVNCALNISSPLDTVLLSGLDIKLSNSNYQPNCDLIVQSMQSAYQFVLEHLCDYYHCELTLPEQKFLCEEVKQIQIEISKS